MIIAVACVGILGIIILGYTNATTPPVVRQLVFTVPDYPAKAEPVRIVLFSDLHVHGPDMPPSRVNRIVNQINALHPDIVVAAGDFTGHNWIGAHYPVEVAIAPLRHLKTRLGVYAVLGNADYDAGAAEVTRALERSGVHVLANNAIAAGPLAVGGLDGRIYNRAAWTAARAKTYGALDNTPGIKLLVAHRPDEFKWAPPSIRLVLAGHTHCGQIVLPLIGALETGSDFGQKYLCGVVRDRRRMLVVSAGLGTSRLPLRIGAPSDIWLILVQGPSTPKRTM